jgi:hypothetical protein
MSDLRCPSADYESADLVLGSGSAGEAMTYERARRAPGVSDADVSVTRLSGICRSGSCANWNDGCVLGSMLAETAVQLRLGAMPHCLIRTECRWFAENGRAACGACALVRFAPATADSP